MLLLFDVIELILFMMKSLGNSLSLSTSHSCDNQTMLISDSEGKNPTQGLKSKNTLDLTATA